jgi:lipoprotein-anchoring transpeptidase ErfK/SrfK
MRKILVSLVLFAAISAVTAMPALADPGTVTSPAGFAWVRSGPGMRYDIVGRVYAGSRVDIIRAVPGQAVNAGDSTWYQIGPERFVYSGQVRLTGTVVTPIVLPTSAPTSTPKATPTATAKATPTATPKVPLTATPKVAPSATATPAATAIPTPEAWVEVILSQQRLIAHNADGSIFMDTLISSGTAYYPTVTGTYRIYVKYRTAPMRGPDYYIPDVPNTMYFYGSYGLHGAYWHDNFGHPMSHGCVNMRLSDAAALFGWTSVGTKVVIR